MMEWQSIDTAPIDGTKVLLWWRSCKEPSIGWYADPSNLFRSYYHFAQEGWICEGDEVIPKNQQDCTHWMPLPEPPAKVAK